MSTAINGTTGIDLEIIDGKPRITGDFSNGTVANRVMFQTSTANVSSIIGLLPNGSSTSYLFCHGASDPTNAANAIALTKTMTVDYNGQVLAVSPSGGLGYGTGAGGTVTQATSKSTAVTLNKPAGQITMNNAALAAGAIITFQFVNSLVSATDVLHISKKNGVGTTGGYSFVADVEAGGAYVTVRNQTLGSLSEAIVLNFAIIKGATS